MIGGVLGALLYQALIGLHHHDNERPPLVATNYNFEGSQDEYRLVPPSDDDDTRLIEVVTES